MIKFLIRMLSKLSVNSESLIIFAFQICVMKVIIVGAGFAGLKIARKLNNKPGFEVTLIDKFNYHQFQPLFYQVATSSLDASNISFPLRKMFQKSKNVHIRLACLKSIDANAKVIHTDEGIYDYDILIIATGADTNFFGNKNVEQNVFPMKSTTEALQLRHRLLQNFEEALLTKDPIVLQKLMNVVVVGGGATGVELSGSIAEMKRYVLPKDYPELDFSKMQIILLEGSGKTLGAMSDKSAAQSQEYLKRLGVTVMTNQIVKDYDGSVVSLQDGSTIPSALVIWAAGIKGNVPEGIDKELIVRGNLITVDRYSRIKGYADIYAIGDVAYMETPKYPKGHPQVATVAIDQAENLVDNLIRMERKTNKLFEFEYHDKGSMATVGRNLAVVDIPKPKLHFSGLLAWLIWMGLHLFLLVGVKNRIMVFINWIVNYLTHDQSLRLIFKEFYRRPPTGSAAVSAEALQPAKKEPVLEVA
jgi:NADH:ubiquinone reductase (H+-translocating)